MATPLGTSFSTDENVVAPADIQLLRRIVKSLVVEFDQEKFEGFLSSSAASPKIMREYRKVSSRTRSQISLEISPKVARTFAYCAKQCHFYEVLKISRVVHTAHVNVSQEIHRANVLAFDQSDGEDQFRHHSPL